MHHALGDDQPEEPIADVLIRRHRDSRIRHIVAWSLIGAFCGLLFILWLTH